jgi:hypothetical protein
MRDGGAERQPEARNPNPEMLMPRLRHLPACLLTALALAACDGAGEHNVPDEANQSANTADSSSMGTAVPGVLPPAGTVNPAAPSGPGTSPTASDSTTQAPNAVGQPVQSGATGPVPPQGDTSRTP